MTFQEYFNEAAKPNSNYYILVTGHSLGAAVADIFVGRHLNAIPGLKENVVSYTFAAPLACSTSTANALDAWNVFNIVNTDDFVTKIGYNIGLFASRIGVDLKYTISEDEKNPALI